MTAPFLTFDLEQALGELKGEEAWRTRPRNAVTLLNDEGMRVVLVGLHADASIESHRAEGPISIQVVAGALHVTAGGESLKLGPGQVVTMQAGVEHEVHAAEESAFLLTIGG